MSNPQTPLSNLASASRGAVAVVHQTADLLDTLADGQMDAALARLQASKDALKARLGHAAAVVEQTALDVLNMFAFFTQEHESQVKANRPIPQPPMLGVATPGPDSLACACGSGRPAESNGPGCDDCQLSEDELKAEMAVVEPPTAAERIAVALMGSGPSLTPEDEAEFDAIDPAHLPEDRIKEIVEYATNPESPLTADEEARDDRRPLPSAPQTRTRPGKRKSK